MSSFNTYVEQRQIQIKRKQRVVALISVMTFLGSTIFAIIDFLTDTLPQANQPKTTEQELLQTKITAEEEGYEIVLQREPSNQTALEGLVRTRIKAKDYKGAQEPLKKLIKFNPDRTDYKALLNESLERQIK